MKSTFSVIFYLKRQVVKKDGTVPVMGRITVDGSQTQFSCKLSVDPKLWDTKGGRSHGQKHGGTRNEPPGSTRCACASTNTIRKSWSVTITSRRKR